MQPNHGILYLNISLCVTLGKDFSKFKKPKEEKSRACPERFRACSPPSFTGLSLGQFPDCNYSAFMTLHVTSAKYPGSMIAGSVWQMRSKILPAT